MHTGSLNSFSNSSEVNLRAIGPYSLDAKIERPLHPDVRRIEDLTWDTSGKPLLGHVIYNPMSEVQCQGSIEIVSGINPVHLNGEPRAAFAFSCSDLQTQEVCARRVMSLLPLIPEVNKFLGTVVLHRSKGKGVVMTSEWASRDVMCSSISRYLPKLVENDASFNRMIARGAFGPDRMEYDQAVLNSFLSELGGLDRHLRWNHSITARFSDFKCRAVFSFVYGVAFELKFDDPEVLEITEELIARIKLGLEKSSVTSGNSRKNISFPFKVFSRKIDDFVVTSMIWEKPCMKLKANFNNETTKSFASLILTSMCGFSISSNVLEDFGLNKMDIYK